MRVLINKHVVNKKYDLDKQGHIFRTISTKDKYVGNSFS